MKILVVSAVHFEDAELLVPYYRMKEARFEMDAASISREKINGKHDASVADELKEAGALYEDREVVADGNLVTSRQPSYLPAFMREIMQMASRIAH